MFSSLKKLFGNRTDAAGDPRSQQANPASAGIPSANPNRAVRHDSSAHLVAAPANTPTTIAVPLRAVLDRLPPELAMRVRQQEVGDTHIIVQMQKVLQQISGGSVKITFGELRTASPPGVFTAETDRDRTPVELPLHEILSRLNPALLARRASQKQVNIPAEVTGPFGGQAQVMFTTAPLKAVPEVHSVSRMKAVASAATAVATSTPESFEPVAPVPAAAPIAPFSAMRPVAPMQPFPQPEAQRPSAPPINHFAQAQTPLPPMQSPPPQKPGTSFYQRLAAAAAQGSAPAPSAPPLAPPKQGTAFYTRQPVQSIAQPSPQPVAQVAPIAAPVAPAPAAPVAPKFTPVAFAPVKPVAPVPAPAVVATPVTPAPSVAPAQNHDPVFFRPTRVPQAPAAPKAPPQPIFSPIIPEAEPVVAPAIPMPGISRTAVAPIISPIAPEVEPERAPIRFSAPPPLPIAAPVPVPVFAPAPATMPAPQFKFAPAFEVPEPEPIVEPVVSEMFVEALEPVVVPVAAASAPAPVPAPVPVTVPAQPAETRFLNVAIAEIYESWPDPVLNEITQQHLGGSFVALPFGIVEPAIRRGKIAFPWATIRSWLQPAVAASGSPFDAAILELPLRVLTPLFLAEMRSLPRQKRVHVDQNIPDIFSNGSQFISSAPTKAPVTPIAASVPPVVVAQAPASAPRPVPSSPGRLADTNYFGKTGSGTQSEEPAPPVKKGPTPGTAFLVRYATPNEIISKASALDGVDGALIALPDGLLVASHIPPNINADTVAAFLPQIFSRVSQCTKELRLGDLNNLNFTVGTIPWKIFKVGAIYFAAFGRPGEPLPTAQLAGIAAELDRKAK